MNNCLLNQIDVIYHYEINCIGYKQLIMFNVLYIKTDLFVSSKERCLREKKVE